MGPHSIGLLVSLCGKASTVQQGSFQLDDGTGSPVQVTSSARVRDGDLVVATGIVGYYFPPNQANSCRFLSTRTGADVKVLKQKY